MTGEDLELPWADDDLADKVVSAARAVACRETFAHHLAKASVERWFAFELAAVLDENLHQAEWTCLVECGASSDVGNLDLVILPNSRVRHAARMKPSCDPWPRESIAIEIKAAHLGDGSGGYRTALASDLTLKPSIAAGAGRYCQRWLGLLITTDGLCTNSPNREATARRAQSLRLRQLRPVPPLFVESAAVIENISYGEWTGSVWIDAISAFSGVAPQRQEIVVRPPDTTDIDQLFDYALQGATRPLAGYDHALAHLGICVADLANVRLEEFQKTGNWIGTFEELRGCLYFEQRRWRHFGNNPAGEDADAIRKLALALQQSFRREHGMPRYLG